MNFVPASTGVAVITLSVALTAPPLAAQILSEQDFLSDIPMAITPTRLSQPVNEIPAAITIITRDMIKASGAREIAEIFNLVPGFQVSYENGHTPIVIYQGLTDQYARRMQVLIDGRSVYSPVVGGVEWSQLPLVMDDIERIEITRGPNAASYGSNAFLAIINIITRHATETAGVFARATRGSNGIRDGVLRFGSAWDQLDYRLTLGYASDEGFADRHDSREVRTTNFRADYQRSPQDTLSLQLGFNNGPRGMDIEDAVLHPERNYEKEVLSRFQQFSWQHDIDNNESLQIQYYHNDHHVDETSQYTDDIREFADDTLISDAVLAFLAGSGYPSRDIQQTLYTSYSADRHDLEAQHTFIPDDDWRIVWGGSFRRDLVYSPGLLGTDSTLHVDTRRLFINNEYNATEKWFFNIGAMWEDNDLTGKSVSPRGAIQLRLDNRHVLRLVMSSATRTPTLLENDGNIVAHFQGDIVDGLNDLFSTDLSEFQFLLGDGNLKNEVIHSREIGLNSFYPATGLSTDFKIFSNTINNLIYFMNDAGTSIPTNGEDITVKGFEAQVDYKSTAGTLVLLGYTYTRIYSDDINEEYTETAPLHDINLLLAKRLPGNIHAGVALYRTTESDGPETGNPVATYNRLDLRLGYPLSLGSFTGELALTARNFGSQDSSWRDDNSVERINYLSISGQWD